MNQTFVQYLKSKSGLEPVMLAWKNQYIKLGHLGGKITLKDPSKQTKEDLSVLLSKDYRYEDVISISYTFWWKQINQTKFSDCDMTEVLFMYFDHSILTNQEKKEKREEKLQNGFDLLIQKATNTLFIQYIDALKQGQSSLSPTVRHLLLHQKQDELLKIFHALDPLSSHQDRMLLTIFAAKNLQDPHGFDEGKLAYSFLLDMLCFYEKKQKEKLTILDRNALLAQYGLIKDDLNTTTMALHLLGSKDGCIHAGWKGFYDAYEPMILTLDNLSQIDHIEQLEKIYIVENPSVFRMLSMHLKEKKRNIGLICTKGQLNSADYSLLDLCREQDLYYAGDFDPEGLLIAQKMMDRYPHLHLWHYDPSNFIDSISTIELSQKRLASLNHIKDPKLQVIAQLLLKHKKAGYQENLLSLYLEDL